MPLIILLKIRFRYGKGFEITFLKFKPSETHRYCSQTLEVKFYLKWAVQTKSKLMEKGVLDYNKIVKF